jgi:hypothetical protein
MDEVEVTVTFGSVDQEIMSIVSKFGARRTLKSKLQDRLKHAFPIDVIDEALARMSFSGVIEIDMDDVEVCPTLKTRVAEVQTSTDIMALLRMYPCGIPYKFIRKGSVLNAIRNDIILINDVIFHNPFRAPISAASQILQTKWSHSSLRIYDKLASYARMPSDKTLICCNRADVVCMHAPEGASMVSNANAMLVKRRNHGKRHPTMLTNAHLNWDAAKKQCCV